jgi:dimethylamine/trimethylamine dehydrogenase
MARDAKYDILFEPIRIGPKTLRNRFYQVPHCSGFGSGKPWSQAGHRGMKAEGGWGAVCTEFAPVSPETDENPYPSARMWDDGDVRALGLMASAAHAHGALAGIELHHGGIHCSNESRQPVLTVSPVAGDGLPIVGQTMQAGDIRRVQEDWVAAARRAQAAEYDIVYVYGGHTYLPMQFLSPFYNKRTDEYGGSLENRARFWLETLELVRGAVGDTCAIAVRISVDEVTPATVPVEEALEFVRMADHLVDLWDVNVSSIVEWGKDAGGSRFYPEGYQLQWTGRVREATAKPIVGVSRMTSPDLMVEIVSSGKWDIIGAARPSIADPFLPRKIEEGRLDDIRECIGGNQCIAAVSRSHHLSCSQNATAGEEYRRGWHPEEVPPAENKDRDVLVVGAGPAGMECAIVLGRRGLRRVHLVDAEAELGGNLRWLTRLPGLGQWARVVNYRRIQLDKLANVEFVPGTRLDAAAVRDYGAAVVVVATGARWAADGLNGVTRGPIPGADAGLAHVLTPEQVVLEGKRPPGKRVVVYDGEGYVTGVGVAELLRGEGYDVEIVSPLVSIAQQSDLNLEGVLIREHLRNLGVQQRTLTTITEIRSGGALAEGFDGPLELEADGVVLVTQRLANEQLFVELDSDRGALEAAGIQGAYRIGDCTAPRTLADAVFDGHRLARELESDDPSRPRPVLREWAMHRAEDVVGAAVG